MSDDCETAAPTAPSILIVDDDEVFGTRRVRAFRDRGYDVRAAVDDILAPFAPGEAVPSLACAEWEHISRGLADCGGSVSEATRRRGLHRRSLQRKRQKYPPRS
jgi:ActR/RegA family two-component response regulator